MKNHYCSGFLLRALNTLCLPHTQRGILSIIIAEMEWSQTNPYLERGEARISVSKMRELTGLTRQGLSKILTALQTSPVGLIIKPNYGSDGRRSTNSFRIGFFDAMFDDNRLLLEAAGSAPQPQLPREAPNPPNPATGVAEHISKNNSNNMRAHETWIDITKLENVHRDARVAGFIREAKAKLACASADVQYIWQKFRSLNLRNGHTRVHITWLERFIAVFKTGQVRNTPRKMPRPEPKLSAKSVTQIDHKVAKLQSLAPLENRQFQDNALRRCFAERELNSKIAGLMRRHDINAFAARWALRGQCIRDGVIGP